MKHTLMIFAFSACAFAAVAQTKVVGPKLVIEADGKEVSGTLKRTTKSLHVYIKPAREGVTFTFSELTIMLMRGGIPQGDNITSTSETVDITSLMKIAKADDFVNIHFTGVKRKGGNGTVTDFTDEAVLGGGVTVEEK